jgi:hypothetical protein
VRPDHDGTGERIRDKIAASKRKGMWMGGNLPLGYDVKDRQLVVNEAEAETVRYLFRRYVELGAVAALQTDLKQHGIVSKVWTSSSGKRRGGLGYSRGALYYLLRNAIYVGRIAHRGAYAGQQPGIVPQDLWDRVQALLTENRQTGMVAVEQGPPVRNAHLPDLRAKKSRSTTSSSILACKRSISRSRSGAVPPPASNAFAACS